PLQARQGRASRGGAADAHRAGRRTDEGRGPDDRHVRSAALLLSRNSRGAPRRRGERGGHRPADAEAPRPGDRRAIHPEDREGPLMPKKILSVLSHTEYGNLEDSDIGLFASAFAPVAGHPMAILLRAEAVNYAVRGQEGTGIRVAGAPVQPGFLIEGDIQSVQE